jgi:dolichol-phosphate mannosyltransferase
VIEQIRVGQAFVFDKSVDETKKIAKEAGAIVIDRKGQGKGEALQEGFEHLIPISDVIVIIDGDGTYFPEEVYPILESLNNADMVVGSRFLGNMSEGAMTDKNKAGNKFINSMINLFYSTKLTDALSGFRAIKVSSLKKIELKNSGFEIEAEMTVKFLKKKLKIVEKPISYRPRPLGSKSKLRPFRDAFRNVKLIVSNVF